MYKSVVLLCVVYCVVIEARPSRSPKGQYLPSRPGYVPVYVLDETKGDSLADINLELAEAFHALPAGRSVGKDVEASPDFPEQADQPQPDLVVPEENVDRRPYEKKILEKKKATEITKPVERR